MLQSDANGAQRAVALHYGSDDGAPVIVASGMGYLAEKIVEVAADNGVPIYEENSLATMLSQLELGQEIPPALYQAVVDIYLFFLGFDPAEPEKSWNHKSRDAKTNPSHLDRNEEKP